VVFSPESDLNHTRGEACCGKTRSGRRITKSRQGKESLALLCELGGMAIRFFGSAQSEEWRLLKHSVDAAVLKGHDFSRVENG
jgi:hypothetical protein